MPEFKIFKGAVQKQLKNMHTNGELFRVQLDKDALWDLYLSSFPDGTNLMFREKTEYDCNCCKQFIRAMGDTVGIVDGEIQTIWGSTELTGTFKIVSDALDKFVKEHAIHNVFRTPTSKIGTDFNLQHDDNSIRWEHFYCQVPKEKYTMKEDDIPSVLGGYKTSKEMFQRACEEISDSSLETIVELIQQNSLYRGEEHLDNVKNFQALKKGYTETTMNKELYCWEQAAKVNMSLRFRNTVIGTLAVDISNGVSLDDAVKMFESKVAPANYKRPSAVVTKGMIKKAQEKVQELGIMDSLYRRHAVAEDLTINNVIYANRDAKTSMNKDGDVFDDMMSAAPSKALKLDKVEEVSIDKFLSDIVPTSSKIEVHLENNQASNMVSLIAPKVQDSPNILKWKNNFTWSYNGEVTDSMKERVKAAGGDVTGVLRFSIQWNDAGDDQYTDFDAHCHEPQGNIIKYNSMDNQNTGGVLDVDIQDPGSKIAVENITWADESKMEQGKYKFLVHNYSSRNSSGGFSAEIEYDGQIYSFNYPNPLKGKQKVEVAVCTLKNGTLTVDEKIKSSTTTKNIWGLDTNNFHNVSMIMNSPNHWDGEETGNKHWFFMLEGCENEDTPRGFFNEFLSDKLTEHRKVFEIMGNKMRVEETSHQLSGLGFSSTKRNHVIVKVTGSFTRIIKVVF